MDLLRNATDWQNYCASLCARENLTGMPVVWGRGPQAYPCLVASMRLSEMPPKFLSCYVYESDARKLLGDMQGAGAVVGAERKDADYAPGRDPADSFRVLAAHALAAAHYLIETGICKRAQYEETFQRFLALVDRASADDHNHLRRLFGGEEPVGESAPGDSHA